jgi:ABC-type branched-subunit amino acid transport system ATPase component
MSTDTLLDARALTKRFDGFIAVNAVDVSISRGTIHSVIGPNGAGKTTFFRLLTGIQRPTSGRVTFAGQEITGRRPYVIARRGLAQSFQITNIFPRLSVLESVQIAILARLKRSRDFLTVFQRRVESEARSLLEQVGLEDFSEIAARELSHGDQRILEMTLALATQPRLLLLDEPTAGMSSLETGKMVELVTDLARAQGLTVLLSEHDMDVVFGISDRVTVLHQGRVISEGPPEQVQDDERVVEVYLGGEA